MSRPRRVLLLALSFGAGHLRAAAAVEAALRAQSADIDVEIRDPLAGSSWWFRALYVWSYWAVLRLAPAVWRRVFQARLRSRHGHTAPGWMLRLGCRGTFRGIASLDPDVIVAAEVGACEIAVLASRSGLTRASIVAVITDAQAEPAWIAPEVTRYTVPDSSVREQLIAWGASADSIAVTGIPVAAAFAEAGRARDGAVDADRTVGDAAPQVLLMGGGMGPTRMDDVAKALIGSGRRMSIVAVTGHDRRIRERLRPLEAASAGTLRVLGWCDRVSDLMGMADILVTKPGGLTIAEAACRGLPMVLCDPIPGPEEMNAARVVGGGAGVLARGSHATAAAVVALLDDPLRRQSMASASLGSARPRAAASIARRVLSVSGTGRPATAHVHPSPVAYADAHR